MFTVLAWCFAHHNPSVRVWSLISVFQPRDWQLRLAPPALLLGRRRDQPWAPLRLGGRHWQGRQDLLRQVSTQCPRLLRADYTNGTISKFSDEQTNPTYCCQKGITTIYLDLDMKTIILMLSRFNQFMTRRPYFSISRPGSRARSADCSSCSLSNYFLIEERVFRTLDTLL